MPPSAHPERPEEPFGPRPAAAPEPAAGERGSPPEPVDWLALPEPVRDRIAELAADALGRLPTVDVPRQLRPVARFAPAKRAKLGAVPLLSALRESSRFRTAVLEWLREHRQHTLDPNAADSVAAAAAAVLLGEADASSRVRLVARNAEENALRAERDAAVARAQRLEAELDRVRRELAEARRSAEEARGEREAELDRLRGRLREQGMRLREAKDAAEQARVEAEWAGAEREAELAELTARLDRERQRVATERARADRAATEADAARESAREARQADEVRLALLIDTLDGAVAGLRRELSLGGAASRRPADVVRGASTAPGAPRGVRDPAELDRLLALPSVHLMVDGYNVTKTGYPELPLADQRERLVHQLAALAARTGAEVTVVFDGAGVLSVPAAAPRGVRVLFSDPGVPADDVIRSLVAAEPAGRPIVVATADRAVVDSVRSRGAYPVPSTVLLSRLRRV
ncbi:Predicted RNA-binding protein containing a PIN domain [Amycolatopsis arida]|uniref:Predicted RNA-binding protein containing a PIN domain n=1 Tax=Amycolatopsis arida TaxID=587909 RepID=A0A1I5XXP3_9PSEU|nr:NYN domain-containing protein [Amycolatopsis arida]TDX97204.1 putative RNA-binding protein with PIN domain [Amycolatopsis arida]SFQ36696.1 Predicted RNA-binding protein containing a PIN domain [Amycolatopsis arida]